MATGVVNTLLGVAVIYGAKGVLGLGDVAANAAGYTVGIAASFMLNARWTFRYSGHLAPAFARFLLVIGCAYALNLLTVLSAIELLGVNAYVAQAAGIAPYTAFTYLASRYLVFAPARASGGRC